MSRNISPTAPALVRSCRQPVLCALLLAAVLLFAGALAHASPLAPDSLAGSDSEAAEETGQPDAQRGYLQRAATWVLITQRQLHLQLNQGIRELRQEGSATAVAWLILISFGYGLFHAAGPGHGKAVITTYLLTHRAELRRGIALSFASAMLQGVTAILLVYTLVKLAGWLSRDAVQQTALVEQVSFALVAALGALLCFRASRNLLRRHRAGREANGGEAPLIPTAPVPENGMRLAFQTLPVRRVDAVPTAAHPTAYGCGHAHHVSPRIVQETGGPWPLVATILAVGSRPCTGAVLILAAANVLGLWGAGIAAVMAMALGTALAISALATLAVVARGWARRLASGMGDHRLSRLTGAVSLVGGLVILLLGSGLLIASLTSPVPALYRL